MADVHIRPIDPDDGPALVAFHQGLSSQSVYNRFFAVHPCLSPSEVEQFTQVDGLARVALVGIADDRIVGVARLECLPATRDAEVAVVVADDHQRHGLGPRLLDHLGLAAVALGVTHLVADVLTTNTAMLHVFRRHAGVQEVAGQGVVHLRFPVVPPSEGLLVPPGRALRLLCGEGPIRTVRSDPTTTQRNAS